MIRGVLIMNILLVAGARSSAEPVDTPAVLTQIRQIAKDESQSYERVLTRAFHIAQKAYNKKEWGRVEESLKSAGLKLVNVRGSGEYRCVVQPNVFAARGGGGMDLYVSFVVSGGRSQPTYSIPEDFTVVEATVGLSATVLVPLERIRKEQWFGKETVIQEALSAWPVREAQATFPVLECVDLSFGEIRDAADGNERQGYRLRLDLVKGRDERQSRRRLECEAAASHHRGQGRGPLEDWLSRDYSPPGAGRKLADDLRRILEAKEPSYQRLLCQATHLVHKAALGREWSEVSQELSGQSLKLVSEHPWQYGTV
jgi:hypothetical protein